MKTATLSIRPTLVLSVIAGLTVVAGIVPLSSSAQGSNRTIATGSNIPLTADAPEQYVVKPGDTLWDISKVFLRDAWYWPEIWHVNPQVENPHRIYPGDVLRLVYIDGEPRVTLAERGSAGVASEDTRGGRRLSPEVRREPLSHAITTIPYDVIAGFAGRPTLLDKDQVKSAPYLVALRDGHVIGAAGAEVYARGIAEATADTRYSIIHIEEPLRDPENNDVLGYSGVYVGSGPVATTGDPAKLIVAESRREALQGDKLFPESVDVNTDFVPHAPDADIDASVMAIQSHTIVGQYQLVALNRGSKDGLEPGHVLTIHQASTSVRDRYANGGLGAGGGKSFFSFGSKRVELPDERVGVVIVFKAFEHMSYALVMETTHEIRQGDRAKSPTNT
jgi:hypothetical protein